MTLDESLGVLEKRLKHPRVQQMTSALHQALIDGRSFSQALRDFPVSSRRSTSTWSAPVKRAARSRHTHPCRATPDAGKNLRDRVQQALIYPAFLAFAGSTLIVIFITFMVPQLTNFMSQTGGTLPLPTRILLEVHHLITGYWWVMLLVFVGLGIGFRAFVASEEGRMTWDRLRLSIPGYGRIRRHQYYAQFSRTLGTLMENGIPLLKALDLVTEIAANKYLETKLRDVRRAVIDGANLSSALARSNFFRTCLPT